MELLHNKRRLSSPSSAVADLALASPSSSPSSSPSISTSLSSPRSVSVSLVNQQIQNHNHNHNHNHNRNYFHTHNKIHNHPPNPAAMGGIAADVFASSPPRPTNLPTGTPTPPPEPMSEPYHGYSFPHNRLKRRLTHPNKTPLVLVSCGSFSPPTSLHMSMFSVAESYAERTGFELVGSYMSPCSDTYGKSSLVPAHHRINMCRLAIEQTNSNAMIDDWETLRRDEAGRPVYTRTADVLKRLDEQLNDVLGGIQTVDGTFVRARVMLLIGADLALTMSDPKVWAPADIDVLLGYYGAFIVERPALCATQDAIQPLKKYHGNIMVVPSFQNDVSSTKARAQIRNGEVAQDLPRSVYDYIKLHHLYGSQPPKDRHVDKNGKPDLEMVSPRLPVASHR